MVLDGQSVQPTRVGNVFRINDINPGSHALNISISSATDSNADPDCEIIHAFEVGQTEGIQYFGETQFSTDACDPEFDLILDTTFVEGGTPFLVDGLAVYNYQWVYQAFDNDPNQTNGFVGETIKNAIPGNYILTISDSNGCQSDPIHFKVANQQQSEPFSIQGALESPDNNAVRVTALPPSCDGENPDGRIGIAISGGIPPYEIKWSVEKPTSDETGVAFEELDNLSNRTHLNYLNSGRYKVEILSKGIQCPNSQGTSSYVYYE